MTTQTDLTPASWVEEALCAQTGTDDARWFPEKGGSATEAHLICGMCPARQACLDDALARNERHGIWGGTTPEQRRHMDKPPRLCDICDEPLDPNAVKSCVRHPACRREAHRRIVVRGRAADNDARRARREEAS